MNAQRNLVMGAAVGYGPEQVRTFLESLRRSGYDGDILLFVDRKFPAQARKLPLMNNVMLRVLPHWFPMKYKLIGRPRRFKWIARPLLWPLWALMRLAAFAPLPQRARLRLQCWLAHHAVPPTESRYLSYLDFLESHDCGRVLHSDVRDVLFQAEPFAHLPARGLAVGIEALHNTIGSERWNRSWVSMVYGEGMLERIGAKPISCSGVTAGDRASMLSYLRQMREQILKLPFRAIQQPLDQALHNVVLWTGAVCEPHLMNTLASPLATLSGVPVERIRRDTRGRIVNADGGLAAIVHQYDRFPVLRAELPRAVLGDAARP